jgi:hypothetical protein
MTVWLVLLLFCVAARCQVAVNPAQAAALDVVLTGLGCDEACQPRTPCALSNTGVTPKLLCSATGDVLRILFNSMDNLRNGTILPAITTLSRLTQLVMLRQDVSASLSTLTALTSLRLLQITEAKVTGNVSVLSSLTALEIVDLARTNVTGSLADFPFERLSSLSRLVLDEVNVSGFVPSTIGLATALTLLSLPKLGLTGTLPSSLSNCRKMRNIDLSHNSFQGPLTAIFGMGDLQVLLLDRAGFDAPLLTPALGQLTNLTELVMSHGVNVGPAEVAPTEIALLPKLLELTLPLMRLQGDLDLRSLVMLRRIDLRLNQLSSVRLPEPSRGNFSLCLLQSSDRTELNCLNCSLAPVMCDCRARACSPATTTTTVVTTTITSTTSAGMTTSAGTTSSAGTTTFTATTPSPPPTTAGVAPDASSSWLGPAIGGAIGGVLILSLISVFVYFRFRRVRSSEPQPDSRLSEVHHPTPLPASEYAVIQANVPDYEMADITLNE